MDRNNACHSHAKAKNTMKSHATTYQPSAAGMGFLSFGCGIAVTLLMLSLFSILIMQLDLPREVLRIPAILSVCLGTFASAATASRFVASGRLVCGAFFGGFYFILLEVSSFFYRGAIPFDVPALINAGVLLLSGAAGGVLSAMNPNSGKVLRG